MPAESTVRLWATDNVRGFAAQYARAREVQADHYADEINEIADQLPEQVQTTRPDGTVETRRDPAYVASCGPIIRKTLTAASFAPVRQT